MLQYLTNPREIEVFVAEKYEPGDPLDAFVPWCTLVAASCDGTHLFRVQPILPTEYPYIRFRITKTFRGDGGRVLLSKLILLSDISHQEIYEGPSEKFSDPTEINGDNDHDATQVRRISDALEEKERMVLKQQQLRQRSFAIEERTSQFLNKLDSAMVSHVSSKEDDIERILEISNMRQSNTLSDTPLVTESFLQKSIQFEMPDPSDIRKSILKTPRQQPRHLSDDAVVITSNDIDSDGESQNEITKIVSTQQQEHSMAVGKSSQIDVDRMHDTDLNVASETSEAIHSIAELHLKLTDMTREVSHYVKQRTPKPAQRQRTDSEASFQHINSQNKQNAADTRFRVSTSSLKSNQKSDFQNIWMSMKECVSKMEDIQLYIQQLSNRVQVLEESNVLPLLNGPTEIEKDMEEFRHRFARHFSGKVCKNHMC